MCCAIELLHPENGPPRTPRGWTARDTLFLDTTRKVDSQDLRLCWHIFCMQVEISFPWVIFSRGSGQSGVRHRAGSAANFDRHELPRQLQPPGGEASLPWLARSASRIETSR